MEVTPYLAISRRESRLDPNDFINQPGEYPRTVIPKDIPTLERLMIRPGFEQRVRWNEAPSPQRQQVQQEWMVQALQTRSSSGGFGPPPPPLPFSASAFRVKDDDLPTRPSSPALSASSSRFFSRPTSATGTGLSASQRRSKSKLRPSKSGGGQAPASSDAPAEDPLRGGIRSLGSDS